MRLPLLLSSVYLATTVVAGGYQGALERVLLYYAYQIDGLNDPSMRSLGIRCVSWSQTEGKCRNNIWREYNNCNAFDDPKKPGGKRCNFWELMTGLGETHGGNNGHLMMPKGTDINAKTLPIEATAVSYYMYTRQYMPINVDGVLSKGVVGDYNPHRFVMDGGTDYSEWLGRLGDTVMFVANSGKKNDGNKWMFEQFESTLKQLRAARIGDNGRYVVDAYKKDSTMDNKYMVTENPGTNPATKNEYKGLDWYDNHKETWIELNWAETQYQMEKGGVKNADAKMAAFRDRFFASESAKKHQAVMNEFELIENKLKGCR
ncbi:hypothetical protein B0I35DRAFT_479868 [Stachybotrys elegans]|uniref:Uncharacterized protein n=1 Tax=Stachybotrys elegans TaxID=80388 RepID=A0A8K0SQP0_9HYPO|nr:hypothetical protein B0I35DRAFT_479868 [Stachybotrys elegans]